jgi:hypothetical protein
MNASAPNADTLLRRAGSALGQSTYCSEYASFPPVSARKTLHLTDSAASADVTRPIRRVADLATRLSVTPAQPRAPQDAPLPEFATNRHE